MGLFLVVPNQPLLSKSNNTIIFVQQTGFHLSFKNSIKVNQIHFDERGLVILSGQII